MLDPYVYPGTNILRNVLGIQERQALDDAEADYISQFLRNIARTSGLRLSLTQQYSTI